MSGTFIQEFLVSTGGNNGSIDEIAVPAFGAIGEKLVPIPMGPGQVILNADIQPIQNIPNFVKTIRRFNVIPTRRGNALEVIVRGTRNESRFRARLTVQIGDPAAGSIELSSESATPSGLGSHPYQIWANNSGSVGFGNLPAANAGSVGFSYYISTVSDNAITIQSGRSNDKILYIDSSNDEQEADAIRSPATAGSSAVLRCVERRVWLVENLVNDWVTV